jgi:DNA-binding beta-propeller fold protein YncE
MKFQHPYKTFLLTAAFLATSVLTSQAAIKVDYIYNLSSFEGVEPFSGGRMFMDNAQNELYVCNSDGVAIFNGSGMEVYTFGGERQFGSLGGGAVDKDGNILLLTSRYNYSLATKSGRTQTDLVLCNYRGEPISKMTLKGVPPEFGNFNPAEIASRGDRLYLSDDSSMKVIVIDWTGKYLDGYNIGSILNFSEQKVRDTGMSGFSVDKDGNIYFTISEYFRAYKMTPNRQVSSWGTPGGAPGKFNIATAIDTDDKGNIYVVDALKASVEVFDKDFHFLMDFGGRGIGPGDLISPQGIMIDDKGTVYVSQSANRGVNVYRISNN